MNPLPTTHSAMSHPRPRRQGPLDNTWRSVHHHRRRRPPSPSLSAMPPSSPSWGWLLLGAACHHCHPHPCRLPPPQPYQRRISAASPPFSSSPPSPSHLLRPLGHPWRHLGPACGVDALRYDAASAAPAHSPLVERRDNFASAAVTAATMPRSPLRRPALDLPSLLGPPPPVGRRRRQHVDVDSRPRCLRRRDDDVLPSR